ncbi:halocyanin domain-containing protein [Halalkalicoccus sp. GCM10025322]|uniref:halocyanin domain-containing protein n=1 Tax=Halalkalicoccus TaxID=332246 RepID=UPI002F967B2A
MTEDDENPTDLSRRSFMRETAFGATAAAGTAATSGVASAQEGNESGDNESGGANESGGNESGGANESGGGNESGGASGNVEPAWPSFVTDANNFNGTEDLRGQGEATVQVGAGSDGLAFDPPGIWVDTGTTVIWEWTGEGGGHNVAAVEGGDFASEVSSESGFTFENTFEEGGIVTYECEPHTSQGMHGGVAVGEEIETQEVQQEGGGGGGESGGGGVQLPGAARAVGVALTVALGSTLGLAYVFMRYGGDYEEDV